MKKLALAILFMTSILLILTILVVFIFQLFFTPTTEEKQSVALKMLTVARLSLFDYYDQNGKMPKSENDRIPTSLQQLYKNHFFNQFGEASAVPEKFIPIDPFNDTVNYRIRIPVSVGIRQFDFVGAPLRYIPKTDYIILLSQGPDKDYDFEGNALTKKWDCDQLNDWQRLANYRFDPTNGSMSSGDLIDITCKSDWESKVRY